MKHMYYSSLFLLGAMPLQAQLQRVQAQDKTKPNILWILSDDERADALACFNRAVRGSNESALGYVSSPNVDKLAAEGVLFSSTYCNNPASAPSRASMHTGRYSHHIGVYGFEYWHDGLTTNKPFFPNNLEDDFGYQTLHLGKLAVRNYKWQQGRRHNGNKVKIYQKDIDYKEFRDTGCTDWNKFGSFKKDSLGTIVDWYKSKNERVRLFYPKKGKTSQQTLDAQKKLYDELGTIYRKESPKVVLGGQSPRSSMETLDGHVTQAFCNFLDNQGKKYKTVTGRMMEGPVDDKPLFVNIGYHFAHTPVLPSKSFQKKFEGKRYNVPSFTKEEFDNMPAEYQKWAKRISLKQYSQKEKEAIIRDYYAYAAMGDSLIGVSVNKFKEYSKAQGRPWVIVFACGDHGWHMNEQGIAGKCSPYLKSNQVALIVAASDKKLIPAGKVVSDFTEYVDIAPTILARAGADLNDKKWNYLDGFDLKDIADKKIAARDYVITQQTHSKSPWASMRTKDFMIALKVRPWRSKPSAKYPPNENIRWALDAPLEDLDLQFFDLRNDPLEKKNLAKNPKYHKLAEYMRKKLCTIVLGDDRVECIWIGDKNRFETKDKFKVSSFASGSDDKKLNIPQNIIPKI